MTTAGLTEQSFKKYMHVERLSSDEVGDLTIGDVWIFPKLDGANGSVWFDDGVRAGLRNRQLELGNDNQGFMKYVSEHSGFATMFKDMPYLHLYGEWLVPHTLKDYREGAWRKFYVFDVWSNLTNRYLTYDEYHPIMKSHNIDVIPPLVRISNPTPNDLSRILESNTYMMKQDCIGEGIVLKRYDFVNKYGRITWGKIVRTELKDKMSSEKTPRQTASSQVELDIIEKYLKQDIVDKVYANLQPWDVKKIPEFLNRSYHDFITEELWDIVKKGPTVNFRLLRTYALAKIKNMKPEIFE